MSSEPVYNRRTDCLQAVSAFLERLALADLSAGRVRRLLLSHADGERVDETARAHVSQLLDTLQALVASTRAASTALGDLTCNARDGHAEPHAGARLSKRARALSRFDGFSVDDV